MKTKILFLLIVVSSLKGFSQDPFQGFITEAQELYAQKNYKQAQLSLQDAIAELNKMMSGQLSDILPMEINGLKVLDGGSAGSAPSMMGGGMQINKRYAHPVKKENEVDIVIMSNSPLIHSMTMMLGNPSMMGPEYKSVRVGTQRAILKSEMEDFYDDTGVSKKVRSTQIQIPLSQTLITIQAKGFANEQEELAFANKLDIARIKIATGE